jgi:cob(I)alamin adenosyltransferase
VQADLFAVGAELGCVAGKQQKLGMALVGESEIGAVEQAIDQAEVSLPPLKNFVLPGGTTGAAALHQARTICRRAERRTLAAGRASAVRKELVTYLNRLSDLLFVLARSANQKAGVADVPWQPRG